MTRRLLLHGFALLVVVVCVTRAYAQDLDPDVLDAADEAGVPALDLAGAVNALHVAGLVDVTPRTYLIGEGLLAPPTPPPCGWPICGPIGARIYCVEGIESTHGRYMYNPQGWPPPYYNEHAQGWLGWLPSTARRWGVQIGNRASEWDGARRMLLAGAGGQFFGFAAGRC